MRSISPTDKKYILENLLDIPPVQAKEFCDTKDRELLWYSFRYEIQALQLAFEARFEGKEDPLTEPFLFVFGEKIGSVTKEIEFSLSDDKWSAFSVRIELLLDYYTETLFLTQRGWRFLQKHWSERFSDPMPLTPGHLLVKIIDREYFGAFSEFFPEYFSNNRFGEINKRKDHRKYLKQKKLLSEIDDNKAEGKLLTKEQQNELASLKKDLEADIKRYYFFLAHRWFLESTCEKYAKGDEILSKRLIRYNVAKDKFFKNEHRWYRSSKNIQIVKGELRYKS